MSTATAIRIGTYSDIAPAAKKYNPRTFIIGEPTRGIDGALVVHLLQMPSSTKNRKIGVMAQTWHIRIDTHPTDAIRSGLDVATCGNCPLRPSTVRENPIAPDGSKTKPCYVMQNPIISMWNAYWRGSYQTITVEQAAEKVAGQPLRFGAYGDPALLGYDVIRTLAASASKTTGYTHAWLVDGFDLRLFDYLMASVDPISADRSHEIANVARTFRVIPNRESLKRGEIECANTTRGITCAECGLCAGNSLKAKNIAVVAH
jgi:hypothetical protein